MALYQYGSSSKASTAAPSGPSEFDILKASHKFLRKDDEAETHLSWNEQVAKKYYSSLYREFAVCDLKHYKSGNFSLRWRTEDEVVAGAGESTCGNTRCPLHDSRYVEDFHPSLKTLELPFSYLEHGESQFALVKVVLCDKCVKKLMWKRNQEKKAQEEKVEEGAAEEDELPTKDEPSNRVSLSPPRNNQENTSAHKRSSRRRDHNGDRQDSERRRRNSRSRSPTRRNPDPSRSHQRSPHHS